MTKLLYRAIAVLVMFSSLSGIVAQDKDNYLFFCPDNDHKAFGYFIGLGGTNSIAKLQTDDALDFIISETTSYTGSMEVNSKLGPSLELGAFVIPRRGFFRMIDMGIGYRNVKGVESVQAVRQPGGDLSYPEEIQSEGVFDYSRVALRLNVQTVTLLGKKAYFHQGPGLYIDQTVKLDDSYSVPYLELSTTAPEQLNITSLNYTAGIAFKLSPGSFLDVYAHMPLISTGGKTNGSNELIYSSSFHNYVFGIRYQWLKPTPDRVCPAFSSGSSNKKSTATKGKARFAHW